jgi:hypothetical protein
VDGSGVDIVVTVHVPGSFEIAASQAGSDGVIQNSDRSVRKPALTPSVTVQFSRGPLSSAKFRRQAKRLATVNEAETKSGYVKVVPA